MWNAGLDEPQAGIKVAGKNINSLRYADDTTLKAESEEELKNLLMRVKEDSENAGLKLNMKKLRSWHPVPSLHGIQSPSLHGNRREKVETVTDFIFLGSKVTADGDCSHEIKKHLPLGRKAMTNLDSILKNRDITLLIKVCTVKAMAFPVVMYRCENWTI